MRTRIFDHLERYRNKDGLGGQGLRAYLLEVQQSNRDHFEVRMALRAPLRATRPVVSLPPQLYGEIGDALKAWRVQRANLDLDGWRDEPWSAAGEAASILPPPIEIDPALWGFRVELGLPGNWERLPVVDLAFALADQSLRLAEMQQKASAEAFAEAFLTAEREIGAYASLCGPSFRQADRDMDLIRRYGELRLVYLELMQSLTGAPKICTERGGDTPLDRRVHDDPMEAN